jgi:hypothetical protein
MVYFLNRLHFPHYFASFSHINHNNSSDNPDFKELFHDDPLEHIIQDTRIRECAILLDKAEYPFLANSSHHEVYF